MCISGARILAPHFDQGYWLKEKPAPWDDTCSSRETTGLRVLFGLWLVLFSSGLIIRRFCLVRRALCFSFRLSFRLWLWRLGQHNLYEALLQKDFGFVVAINPSLVLALNRITL